MVSASLRILYINQKNVYLSFEKHCSDNFSIPPIREPHDSYFYDIYFKTGESCFGNTLLSVVLSTVRNVDTKDRGDTCLPIKKRDIF